MIALHAKSLAGPPVHNPNLRTVERKAQPTPLPPRTLIADDDPGILTALQLLLGNNGYELEIVSSPAAVLEAVGHQQRGG